MTLTIGPRLHALAAQELTLLGDERQTTDDRVANLQRLEAQSRALFLMEERDIVEVQPIIASHLRAWLGFIRSDLPEILWTGGDGPQASEYLMIVCDLLIGGLLEAIAVHDTAAMGEFRGRFLDREWPDLELSRATMILARQLCLLFNEEFERSADELEESWDAWVESDLIHPQDELWIGVRGMALDDTGLVHTSLQGLSKKREAALLYAVDSGLILRSTLPTRLALQTDSGALLRLAQTRGMDFSLKIDAFLKQRAGLLWQVRF